MIDLISRQAAIDCEYQVKIINDIEYVMLSEVQMKMRKLPSADRPQGEWIGYNADKEDWLRTDGTPIFLVCDKCHETVLSNASAHWNFCPNCGSDNRGEE